MLLAQVKFVSRKKATLMNKLTYLDSYLPCSAAHMDETLSTLSYASRAKNIRNAPTLQMDPHEAALTALRREMRLLRTENAFLREQLIFTSQAKVDAPALLPSSHAHGSQMMNSPAQSQLLPPGSASPSPSGAATLPAKSVMVPFFHDHSPELSDITQRLVETQRLLTTLASDNARLAVENDRLRAGGLQVAGDYSGAVEEVEWLRAKLARLEARLFVGGCPAPEETIPEDIAITKPSESPSFSPSSQMPEAPEQGGQMEQVAIVCSSVPNTRGLNTLDTRVSPPIEGSCADLGVATELERSMIENNDNSHDSMDYGASVNDTADDLTSHGGQQGDGPQSPMGVSTTVVELFQGESTAAAEKKNEEEN